MPLRGLTTIMVQRCCMHTTKRADVRAREGEEKGPGWPKCKPIIYGFSISLPSDVVDSSDFEAT